MISMPLSLQDAPEPCRVLYEYWNAIRGEALVPRRAQFDPLALVAILPMLQLFELQSRRVIRCKLAGTALRDFFGFDCTGRNLIELTPPDRQRTRSWRNWTGVAQPCGGVYGGTVRFASGAHARFVGISLPLRPDRDGAPPQIVSVVAGVADLGWINKQTELKLLVPDEFVFLDIGAGVPDHDVPPDDWSMDA
jgi:hypothetical protein